MGNGNAGEARLDVIALGRDEVTATMNKVEGELDRLGAKLREYERAQKASGAGASAAGKSVNGLGESLKGVKDKFAGVNQGREVFENLRSNVGFVIGTVASLAVGVGTLIGKLTDAGGAVGDLADRAKDFDVGRTALERGLDAISAKLGQNKDKFEEVYNAAVIGASTARLELNTVERALGENAVAAARWRIAQEEANKAGDTLLAVQALGQRTIAEKNLAEMVGRRRDLAREIAEWEGKNLEFLKMQSAEIGKQLIGRTIPGVGLALALGADRATGGVVKPTPTPGGGGGFDANLAWQEKVRAAQRTTPSALSLGEFAALERTIQEASGNNALAALNKGGKDDESVKRHREEIDKLAESYREWASVLSNELGPILPGIGSAISDMGDLFAQLAKIDDVNERANRGVAGSIKATFDLAAANAKTAREAFTYKGLGAAAEAIGAYARYDYAAGALYTAQAAAFGVAAAAAGGGGGSAGGARAGGAARPSGARQGASFGDGGTTIINFNQLVADKQTVTRSVQDAGHVGRNNGYARRRGP